MNFRRSLSMAQDDDPREGTYATRAEARRRQQQLEGQQVAGLEPANFIIRDNLDRVVI